MHFQVSEIGRELLCVKKFPPNPLQETLLILALPFPLQGNRQRQAFIDVLAEASRVDFFSKKALPEFLS
jgi:hypothetical protein